MESQVCFVKTGIKGQITDKIKLLFQKSDLVSCIDPNDMTAVKIHFGDTGNTTHISPDWVRPVVDGIRDRQGKPFLTDTCVLYKSLRDNGVDHLRLAYEHGFTIDRTGAPVIIGDGLLGNLEREVTIPGKIFNRVSVASIAVESNAMMVLTHVTGHMASGLGAAIKNIGMGFASRKGKLRQHSVMKPAVSSKKCTGCEVCTQWCPEDAISMNEDAALIDSEKCIGCGECLTVCRFDAIRYDWRVSPGELQKRMAEHALGVVIGKKNKVGYMNFLINMTKDCDCMAGSQSPMIPDIGVLASKDPVAIDTATLDLVKSHTGKDIAEHAFPHIDPYEQLRHGEEIGLGSHMYKLVEIG